MKGSEASGDARFASVWPLDRLQQAPPLSHRSPTGTFLPFLNSSNHLFYHF